jgi:hypothetical protein
MLLFVTDLRLGAGNALEDFLEWGPGVAGPADRATAIGALHERFSQFLAERFRHAHEAGLRPHLVLLGNTLNLWQVQRPGEKAASAVARILATHQPVVAALRHWCDAGGDLDLVIGSHDQPLVDASAWAVLKERLPRLNALNGGGPAHAFRDEACGVYAEYGHRFDPLSRLRGLGNPGAGGALRRLTRCVTSVLEPLEPWIDKVAVTAELLLVLECLLATDARAEVRGTLLRGMTAIRVLRRLAKAGGEVSLEARTTVAMLRAARSMARRYEGRACGKLPVVLRFVALGHPASPRRLVLERGVELVSPASWCPTARVEHGAVVSVEQALGYVMLVPDGSGGWEVSVRQFAEEAGASS